MKRKLKIAGCVLGILLVALPVFIYLAHVNSKSPLEEYKAKLRASGEKLAIEDWISPRAPADQNSAELLRQQARLSAAAGDFIGNHLPPAMQLASPGKAIISWQQPEIRGDKTTNSWNEMDAALQSRADELELLHKIIEHPTLDFELEYKKGFNLLLPFLAKMKGAAQLLSAAAMNDLRRGDTASAITNTRAILAISKGMRGERLVISQLVRIAISAIAVPPTWELLQSTNVTDAQMITLQKDWQDLEFIQGAEEAMEMERAMSQMTLAKMRASRNPFDAIGYPSGGGSGSSGTGDFWDDAVEFSKEAWNGAKREAGVTVWRVSLSYKDELRALQGQQVIIDTFREVRTNQFFANAMADQDRKLNALAFKVSPQMEWIFEQLDIRELGQLMSGSVDALRGFVKREMNIEAARQLALTAIALKRFQLKHGSYPENLSALVPEYLSATPTDPVDGSPLRYRRNGDDSFLLYSIGEDMSDDGGDPTSARSANTLSWQRGRDLVWPQPATEKEVQAFYATNSLTR
jgi:hypothetical protein